MNGLHIYVDQIGIIQNQLFQIQWYLPIQFLQK